MTIRASQAWSWTDPKPGGKAWSGKQGDVVPAELPGDVISALLTMWNRNGDLLRVNAEVPVAEPKPPEIQLALS